MTNTSCRGLPPVVPVEWEFGVFPHHICARGTVRFNRRGSPQTLWGLTHSKSGRTERATEGGWGFLYGAHNFANVCVKEPLRTNYARKVKLTTSVCESCTQIFYYISLGQTSVTARRFGKESSLFRSLLLLGKWEDPKSSSQKGELFQGSVIQKRPFNARSWGAEENVGVAVAVNYWSRSG